MRGKHQMTGKSQEKEGISEITKQRGGTSARGSGKLRDQRHRRLEIDKREAERPRNQEKREQR